MQKGEIESIVQDEVTMVDDWRYARANEMQNATPYNRTTNKVTRGREWKEKPEQIKRKKVTQQTFP